MSAGRKTGFRPSVACFQGQAPKERKPQCARPSEVTPCAVKSKVQRMPTAHLEARTSRQRSARHQEPPFRLTRLGGIGSCPPEGRGKPGSFRLLGPVASRPGARRSTRVPRWRTVGPFAASSRQWRGRFPRRPMPNTSHADAVLGGAERSPYHRSAPVVREGIP